MHFLYPNQEPSILGRCVAQLACYQILPTTAPQLASALHFIAEDTQRKRLTTNSSCIRPGSSVELFNTKTQLRGWLQLVYPAQSSFRLACVSVLSPLGIALIGNATGTDVQLTLLRHRFHFQVLTVLNVRHTQLRSCT